MNRTRTVIENALSSAFDTQDRNEASRRAKQVVATELRSLDRRVDVRSTGYFTHSYIPDLVVEWRDKGTQFQRDVYLRFHIDTADVEADIHALAKNRPMFVALGRDQGERVLRLPDDAPNTLLTHVVALEKFTDPRITTDTLGRLMSSGIVRGGRGLLLEDDAARATEVAQHGLDVIRSGSQADAASTISTLASFLRTDHAVRLTRFMQMMWLAYGHNLDELPGEDMLTGRLSDVEVRELLSGLFDGAPLEDPPFWRRLGGLLDVAQLEAFGNYPPNANLCNLVSANLDRFRAVILALTEREASLFQDDDGLYWSIRDRSLALEGPGFMAQMASDRRRFAQLRETRRLPTWLDLRERLSSNRIQRLVLIGPTTRMVVEADQIRNLRDADVPSLSSAFREDMRVKSLLLVDPRTGFSVEADLARWVVDGGDTGTPVGHFALAGLDVLWAPDTALRQQLEEFLREPDADLRSTDLLLREAAEPEEERGADDDRDGPNLFRL